MQTKKAYLVLENGMVFCGRAFGYEAETIGEAVFTTAMTGYMSTLTDQGYKGQLVVQTFPLIGNYGVVSHECETKGVAPAAYIVRDLCQEPSNFRCEGALGVFLNENKVVGIEGIDTRKLTRILRDNGSMMAKITYTLPENVDSVIAEIKAYTAPNMLEAVTCSEVTSKGVENAAHKVVLWDFGAVDSIAASLSERGCEVTIVPASTKAEEILKYKPDGVVLSNGPDDPMKNPEIIAEIGKLADKKMPLLGICLGHLMLAVSQGAKSIKLPHGHRGGMPSIRLSDKRVFITSQNQGYTLDEASLPENIKVSYKNGNDGTVEGVTYESIPAIGVQFRPGSVGGPNRTDFVYDEFIGMMK